MMNHQQHMKRLEVEVDQRWLEEMENIPFIQFPAGWKVQVIPPFHDAVVRFRVELPSGAVKSVYLDVRSSLGFYGGDFNDPTPYWEVYPYRGDVGRCLRENVGLLLAMIEDESTNDEEL